MGLSKIEEVIEDASQGKIFILVDDEDRENEGDLINSIQALINMSDEDRTKLSDNSYTAARIFHTKTIQQWIDLLTGNNE